MLEYENQMLLDLLHEDGLLVAAKGLGVERILESLLITYNDPGNLVIVMGTNPREEEYLLAHLETRGISPLPRCITSDCSVSERSQIYQQGGVMFVTTRIMVMDMLMDRAPIDLITGFIVWRAHKILESCQEAFILRLYRQKNKTGFVKALTSSPLSFTAGFCHIERVMRNLFVKKLYLWPRFHMDVSGCLEHRKPDVIEIHLTMTTAMKQIQMSVLDLITNTVQELRRSNSTIDTDEFCAENAISKSFEKMLKVQLEPIWHQLSVRTKQLVADIKVLRTILGYLTQYDCVTFYNLVSSLRTTEKAIQSSGWMLLNSAESLFINSKLRVFGNNTSKSPTKNKEESSTNKAKQELLEPDLEVNPKWVALSEVLDEVRLESSESKRLERCLIVTQDDRTAQQLNEYLRDGAQRTLRRIFYRTVGVKLGIQPPQSFLKDMKQAQRREGEKKEEGGGTGRGRGRGVEKEGGGRGRGRGRGRGGGRGRGRKREIEEVETEREPKDRGKKGKKTKTENSEYTETENNEKNSKKGESEDLTLTQMTKKYNKGKEIEKNSDNNEVNNESDEKEMKNNSSDESEMKNENPGENNDKIDKKKPEIIEIPIEKKYAFVGQSDDEENEDENEEERAMRRRLLSSPLILVQSVRSVSDPFLMARILEEVEPKYIVLYDADLTFIRQLEIWQACHSEQVRVYFLIYKGTTEEQVYLTNVKREKDAFEYLIREKSTMVIPEYNDGKSGDHPDLIRDHRKASEMNEEDKQNTRKGGQGEDAPTPAPRIIVDVREFRSELPALLHKRGIDIDPVTIEVGDYILTPDICVERKSLSDLIGSLNSGRLYNQAQAMTRYYKRPILLIEFDQNKPFHLQGRYYLSSDGSSSSKDIAAKLQLLTLHFPHLRIMWCPSPYASAEIFHMLKIDKEEPSVAAAQAITAETNPDSDADRFNPQIKDLVSKLPGINTKNMFTLLNKVSDLPELLSMSKETLTEILGSDRNASALYGALHNKMKPPDQPQEVKRGGKFTKRGLRRFRK